MIDHKLLPELKVLGISETDIPNTEQWSSFIDSIQRRLEIASMNEAQSKNMLDLGFQEMQKFWQLIEQRESLIKSILDSSGDGILTLDSECHIIEFNHGAEKLFDVEKSKIIGKKIFSILSGGSLKDEIHQFIENPHRYEDSIPFFNENHQRTVETTSGKIYTTQVRASRVGTSDGYVYPIYIKDITQELRNHMILEESRAQMMASSKFSALGEMAGGMAHEINTPLAIIQLRADQIHEALTENTPIDESRIKLCLKCVDSISITVKRIAKLISGLRNFARDGSKDPLDWVHVEGLVQETFAFCKERFHHHGVELKFIGHDLADILCRPSEINQVLLNILNNAFDAVDTLENKWIHLETQITNDKFCISITDSGSGIPKDVQTKMMQPFFTTKDFGKGTGLGLSISKGLLEAMGASLCIDNNCKNTKFVIQFSKNAFRRTVNQNIA